MLFGDVAIFSEDTSMEWENAKCRWAVYFGDWPAWVNDITVPATSDVILLRRQFNAKRRGWDGVQQAILLGMS